MDQPQLPELARRLVASAAPLIASGASVPLAARALELLQRRFAGDDDAEDALRLYQRRPEDTARQQLVIQQIVTLFQRDSAATEELRTLVAELQRQAPAPERSHSQYISGGARVGTAISGDVHGNVTSIGGNVSGPVLSGDFQGPVTIGGATVRNVNTGGGDYAEGDIDKSRRVIVSSAADQPVVTPRTAVPGPARRGPLPPTLSADGAHFSYGHALLIGVGEYANAWHSAPTTANDAMQLAELLRDVERAAYPADQVTLLQNQQATRAGILAALDALAARLKDLQSQPQRPTVVLFFAGHGVRRDGTFYLLPHDYADGDAAGSAISARTFRQKVQMIAEQSQKLLVLLNCCYAGGAAGAVLSGGTAPQTSAPTRDFVEALAQGNGQVVISSSRSEQPSSAEAEDDPSLTTFGSQLLGGLRGAAPGGGPAVGVLDLFAHLAATVPADARSITHEGRPLAQHPLLFARAVDQNFPVALRPIGQEGGTLDADRAEAVRRLAEIEIELFSYERDSDAPELLRERDALLQRLGG